MLVLTGFSCFVFCLVSCFVCLFVCCFSFCFCKLYQTAGAHWPAVAVYLFEIHPAVYGTRRSKEVV